MNRPIVKIGVRENLPPIRLELTPMQHAVNELAIKFLLQRIDAKDFAALEDETVRGFADLRTTLFGIQSQMRCAALDAAIETESTHDRLHETAEPSSNDAAHDLHSG